MCVNILELVQFLLDYNRDCLAEIHGMIILTFFRSFVLQVIIWTLIGNWHSTLNQNRSSSTEVNVWLLILRFLLVLEARQWPKVYDLCHTFLHVEQKKCYKI